MLSITVRNEWNFGLNKHIAGDGEVLQVHAKSSPGLEQYAERLWVKFEFISNSRWNA